MVVVSCVVEVDVVWVDVLGAMEVLVLVVDVVKRIGI